MIKTEHNQIAPLEKQCLSKAGYLFEESDSYWKLDKNTNVPIDVIRELLNEKVSSSCIDTLKYYATNLSGSHTKNIVSYLVHMLKTTEASEITENMLINYRGSLTSDKENYLV